MSKNWLVEVSIGSDFNTFNNSYFYIPMENYDSAKEAVEQLDSILKGYRRYSFIEDGNGRHINVSKISTFKIGKVECLTDKDSEEISENNSAF